MTSRACTPRDAPASFDGRAWMRYVSYPSAESRCWKRKSVCWMLARLAKGTWVLKRGEHADSVTRCWFSAACDASWGPSALPSPRPPPSPPPLQDDSFEHAGARPRCPQTQGAIPARTRSSWSLRAARARDPPCHSARRAHLWCDGGGATIMRSTRGGTTRDTM